MKTTYWIELVQPNGYVDYVPLTATTDRGARMQFRKARQAVGPNDKRRIFLCFRHESGATGTL